MSSDFYIQQFVDAIDQCRRIYVDKTIECYMSAPGAIGADATEFFDDLQQRFNSLVIKVFVETVESDLVLTPSEAELGQTLVQHLLKERVKPKHISRMMSQLSKVAKTTTWQFVLEPITKFDGLHQYYEEAKLGLLRIANIVAKVDGVSGHETVAHMKMLRLQFDQQLSVLDPVDESVDYFAQAKRRQDERAEEFSANKDQLSSALLGMLADEAKEQPASATQPEQKSTGQTQAKNAAADVEQECVQDLTPEQREERLNEGLAELDGLVGITEIRHEVRTLINVCKLQQFRASHSMPTSRVSLHIVFTGNPGTGKTTVARIIGKLFGAIGVIQRGHLVETDRSGLVAEFQGQTATKTNAKIDEALDGVLFIDEAYSLVPQAQADSYGLEAIQVLLKRMEDDRDRLVVILAGYTDPMDELLKSNPGLSSRFARRCRFPDYGAEELLAIFQNLSDKNHYQLDQGFESRLRARIEQHVAQKDEHFGNGRLVRNMFEQAMRNMANRIVQAENLTPDLLSTFIADDLVDPDV